MPTNLTDVDAFTSPVVVPSRTDPRSFSLISAFVQALANRTRYLFNRANQVARVAVIGSGVAENNNMALTLAEFTDPGWSGPDSTHIQFPAPGTYEITVKGMGQINSAVADNNDLIFLAPVIGTTLKDHFYGVKTPYTTDYWFSGSCWVTVANVNTDRLSLLYFWAAHTSRTFSVSGSGIELLIRRLF